MSMTIVISQCHPPTGRQMKRKKKWGRSYLHTLHCNWSNMKFKFWKLLIGPCHKNILPFFKDLHTSESLAIFQIMFRFWCILCVCSNNWDVDKYKIQIQVPHMIKIYIQRNGFTAVSEVLSGSLVLCPFSGVYLPIVCLCLHRIVGNHQVVSTGSLQCYPNDRNAAIGLGWDGWLFYSFHLDIYLQWYCNCCYWVRMGGFFYVFHHLDIWDLFSTFLLIPLDMS